MLDISFIILIAAFGRAMGEGTEGNKGSEACVGEICVGQGNALIQHASGLQRVELGGFSVGHDNTVSCGFERERVQVEADCREAANALGVAFGSQGSFYAWPPYCFKYNNRLYFNNDVAASSARDTAYMVCQSATTTTATATTAGSTTSVAAGVTYHMDQLGAPFCQEGEVVDTLSECASTEVAVAIQKRYVTWGTYADKPSGCLYHSSTDGLYFNYREDGSGNANSAPICKVDTRPATHIFHLGQLNTNSCAEGQRIEDPQLCREAAADLGQMYGTDGSYSGYPSGCFALSNGNTYFNRNDANGSNGNARPLCVTML